MNWDAIGAVSEILGAIAVFASLLYLARQIKFSALSTRSQMEAALGQRGFEAYDPVYQGRNAQIFFKGLSHPDNLNEEDSFVFDLLMHRQFGTMIEIARQIESGIIEPDGGIVVGFREHYNDALLRHPGARRWLSNHQPYSDQVLRQIGLSLG